jgi:hypothetical protein
LSFVVLMFWLTLCRDNREKSFKDDACKYMGREGKRGHNNTRRRTTQNSTTYQSVVAPA